MFLTLREPPIATFPNEGSSISQARTAASAWLANEVVFTFIDKFDLC